MRLAPLPRAGQRAPDRAADAITRFAGSMLLIYRHLAWFVLWTVSNVAAPSRFNRHPIGLLTLIVSLEAIFVSIAPTLHQDAADGD
jgi:uncharacterized membrane protein